jgi:ABC-type nitrate/sulfonate/bicarbonate transport system substrate-binding protein
MFKLLTLIFLLVFIVSACGKDDDDKDSDSDGNEGSDVSMPSEMTDISFQLSWFHEYSSAPIYTAIENDHFTDLNLNVTLPAFTCDESFVCTDPIAEVVSGNSQFGTAGGSAIAQARADGQPVVAVMSMLQRDPFTIISLSDSGITTPTDLIGKTIAVNDQAATTLTNRILASQGIDPSEVTIIPRTDFQIGQLQSGEADAIGAWIINEGVMVTEAELEPNFLLASDYGIDQYSFAIFTTQDMVDNNPEIVEAFVRGLIAGLDDVVSDQEAATDDVLVYAPNLDRDGQLARVRALLPLIKPSGSNLGDMQVEVWDLTKDLVVEDGLIDESFDISQAYTMQFVDKIYNR